ncbi:hypothetical protein JOD45_000356 [Scopulibacillus daqui]|uniref:Uncharacterized protein n=1 Tax=Scopulibacillus daqui TaxID=1469162 RepID=A0ABS2PVX6_9BACL|nr:hypothetical protein [Scopulibacillus daqui]MBM7644165.1 hypothetical protein [Scopulibacillus daqui]
MEIYFSPELIKQEAQILNIIDQDSKPVGYMSFLFDDKKLYIHGHLEEKGVSEDFKDLVKPYIKGLINLKPDCEVYSYLSIGGEKLELESSDNQKQ